MNIVKINYKNFDLARHQQECEKHNRYYRRKSPEERIVFVQPNFLYLQNLLPEWTFIPLEEDLKGELDQDFSMDIQNEFNTTSLLKWKHLGILLNDDCKMHKLSKSEVSNFYDLSCVYRIRGTVSQSLIEEVEQSLKLEVSENTPLFVKNEDSSGKNINSLKPVKAVSDLVVRIMTWYPEFEQFLRQDKKEEFIFFTWPWLELDKTREFRLFVYQKKIVTICPQKYFDIYPDKINHSLLFKAIHKLQNEFVDKFEHQNYSMDVYYINQSEGFKVIEFNQWFNSHPGLLKYEEIEGRDNSPVDVVPEEQQRDVKKIIFKFLI